MWLLTVELAVSVVAAVVFVGALGDPRRSRDRLIAWHLWAFSLIAASTDLALLLMLIGFRLPVVLFVVLYGGQAGVVVQRAWLVVRGRKARKSAGL